MALPVLYPFDQPFRAVENDYVRRPLDLRRKSPEADVSESLEQVRLFFRGQLPRILRRFSPLISSFAAPNVGEQGCRAIWPDIHTKEHRVFKRWYPYESIPFL